MIGFHAYRWDVVDVWFLHHGAHRVLHRAVGEFIVRVLVPNGFQVKVRAADFGFEEGQSAGM